MDTHKRARAAKREIEKNVSVLIHQHKKASVRRNSKRDTENAMIRSLRQEQKLKWSEIASSLNGKRREAGETATFTEATVYSRFIFQTTRVAEPVGEFGFDPKDYAHLRHPNQYTEGGGDVIVSKAGRKRIKDYENARELKNNVRQPVGVEAQGDLESAEKTEQLVEAVAKVERNFWRLVADEMERATTKLYKPEELANRYHAI